VIGVSRTGLSAEIAAIRRFNRFYTGRIALLNETLLDSPFTLTEARVLFELGTRQDSSAGALAETLSLDPGYLSRILQDFSGRRLITRQRAAEDARRAKLALTAKGRKVFLDLDRKSQRSVGEMIAPLPAAERRRLLAAMRAVEAHLSAEPRKAEPRKAGPRKAGPRTAAPRTAAPRTAAPCTAAPQILIRPHRIGDVGWAIERHGTLYAEEFGWNGEFEALVATLFARFAAAHDAARERFWMAEADGERVGCVFVVRSEHDPSAAQLRCLLVDPHGRGLGIGRLLVEHCLAFAKSAGYAKMILWTNDVLAAARRIYVGAGFELVEESPHRSFGHDLVGQIWAKDL
jgi:DNA-binding MarR family transcriptional regulator/GNAT superfamily N-acetyltransferase